MFGLGGKKPSSAERALALAVDTRKFEIERFWQRALFFWGFIAAAAVAYSSEAFKDDHYAKLVIACFGVVCSLAWTLGNRGSKYWQEAWERKVENLEQDALGMRLFSQIERPQSKGFWGGSRFSVSQLAIALSDFTLIVWVVAMFRCVKIDPAGMIDVGEAVIVGFTAFYGLAMFLGAKVKVKADQ